jgi:putative N-acetylmannosamine-6-phosphate epimerase
MNDLLQKLQGGIVVSCQSSPGDPTDFDACIVVLALSAERGGIGSAITRPWLITERYVGAIHG